MIINTHPPDRCRMIHELSDLLSTPAEYLRSPTYGYRIGHLIVNRDGTITTESPHMVEVIRPFLLEHNYLIEETPTTSETPLPAPITRRSLRITAGIGELNAFQFRQLLLILYCRQYILNRMLKTNELFIDYEFAVNWNVMLHLRPPSCCSASRPHLRKVSSVGSPSRMTTSPLI